MKVLSVKNNFPLNEPKCSKIESSKTEQAKSQCKSSLDILGFCGQAQINMQNKTPLEAQSIVESLLSDEQKISRNYFRQNSQFFAIAKSIEGFIDLYETVKFACANYDNDNNLEDVYVLDKKTKEIEIFNAYGKKEKSLDTNDYAALKYYKYHPDALHNLLRRNIQQYRGDWYDEVLSCINGLEKIFADDKKVLTTKKDMTLYRALENSVEFDENGVHTDKSFVSTSTDINCAKRFLSASPLMEIEVPKGTKYLDMDRLFNIDRRHFQENEFLLNKNSRFKVTGFDEENNIIKAKLLC